MIAVIALHACLVALTYITVTKADRPVMPATSLRLFDMYECGMLYEAELGTNSGDDQCLLCGIDMMDQACMKCPFCCCNMHPMFAP